MQKTKVKEIKNKVILSPADRNCSGSQPCKQRDLEQRRLKMTDTFGFTLIELLVVVLIIGVLTAIAIPQYEKAVEKAKATEAITLLRSVVEAVKIYHLANGTYPTKFDDLDIHIPFYDTSHHFSDSLFAVDTPDWKANNKWTLTIYQYYGTNYGIKILNNSGKYKGGEFVYFFSRYQNDIPENQIACSEYQAAGFKLPKGSYCQKIFNGTLYKEGGSAYSLP